MNKKRANKVRHQKYYSTKKYTSIRLYKDEENEYLIKYRRCDSLLKVQHIIKESSNTRNTIYTISKSDKRWETFYEYFRKGNEIKI